MAISCDQVGTLGFSIFFIDAKKVSSELLDSYFNTVFNSAVVA